MMRAVAALALLALSSCSSLPHALAADASAAAPLSLAALLSPLDRFPIPPAPARSFLCLNAGSYTRLLALSMVGDGVCDCCDGSDENIKGGNPWFGAEGRNKAATVKAADAVTGTAGSGSGWLSSLLGSDSDAGAAKPGSPTAVNQGPCPNTCAEHGAAFLASFEARVADYASGVALKAQRLRELPQALRSIGSDLAHTTAMLDQAVQSYREAVALHNDPSLGQSQQSYEALMEAQHAAGALHAQVEQLKWMQGQTVAMPGARPNKAGERPARPPGHFGPQREWLLLWDVCLPAFEWPQRRWGHFGESVDWYRMRLCPLQNATQQAMSAPKPALTPMAAATIAAAATAVKAGESDATAAAAAALAADASAPAPEAASASAETAGAAAAAVEEEEEEEEAQQFVLGWWTGDIVEIRGDNRDRAPIAPADTEGALSAAAASVAAPTSRSPPAPAPAPAPGAWGAPAPGSVLSSTPEPRFQLSLRGGDNCWQVGPRQAEIEVQCGGGGGTAGTDTDTASASSASGDRVLRIEEDGKCRYRFVVASSLACSAEHLALMQTQLRDYRTWFGRRPPPPAAPRTVEEHWARHDEL